MAGSFSLAFVGTAFADAELSRVKGNVLVNTGTGYLASVGAADLKAGTRILVSPNSSAILKFPDGCAVPLNAGIVTVGAKSPCSFKAADLPDRGEPVAPVAPVAGAGFGSGVLLAAGAGTVLLGVGIWAATKNDKNKFASP